MGSAEMTRVETGGAPGKSALPATASLQPPRLASMAKLGIAASAIGGWFAASVVLSGTGLLVPVLALIPVLAGALLFGIRGGITMPFAVLLATPIIALARGEVTFPGFATSFARAPADALFSIQWWALIGIGAAVGAQAEVASSMSLGITKLAGLLTRVGGKAAALSAVLDQAAEAGILVESGTYRVVDMNQAMRRMAGVSQAQATGTPLSNYFSDGQKGIARLVESPSDAGSPTSKTLCHSLITSAGTPIEVESRVARIDLPGKSLICVISRDLTERRIEEKVLRETKDAAELANRSKNEFLANVSHEVRTPVNAVIGMAELLSSTRLDQSQLRQVRNIQHSSEALLTILNDILDLARMEAGRMEIQNRPFDLRECVESCIEMLGAQAGRKGIDIVHEIADDVPLRPIADGVRLRQVLVNLIGNAIKFTEYGEVELSVAARRMDETRQELTFAVRDSGSGIPASKIAALFKPFSQVDTTATRRHGGAGLGLAISARLVELMGGKIGVESEDGKGSTFSFTVVVGAQDAPALVAAAIDPAMNGRRALVLERNPAGRRMVSRMLRSWGFEVVERPSWQEAVALLSPDAGFHLLVADRGSLQSGPAGRSSAAQLPAAADALRELPLLLLNRNGQDAEGEAIESRGWTRGLVIVTKPVTPAGLRLAVQQSLGAAEKTVKRSDTRSSRISALNGSPLRVLVAEDNELGKEVALGLVRRLGHEADHAWNGREVLEAMERRSYDAILMDVQMPEMDGFEATSIIKSRWPDGRRPRIIALTAHAMASDRERCLAAGMDDYLSKPVRLVELDAAIRACRKESPRLAVEIPSATAAMSVDPGVHGRFMDEYAGGDPAAGAELVKTFLRTALQSLEGIEAGLRVGETDKVRRAAHDLKSGSATVGATRLSEICWQIESAAREGEIATAAQLAVPIRWEFESVSAQLAKTKA